MRSMLSATPSTWVIGDVQGCCDQLEHLHALIRQQDPSAHIVIAGDMVNRGPNSLATLRKLIALGDQANSVLGNHDLALLAMAYGTHQTHDNPYLRPILDAPDREQLLHWVRHRPIALYLEQHLIVHAGVLPSWSVEQTMAYAQEAEAALQGPDFIQILHSMYGNQPDTWDTHLTGMERLRCIFNVFTRLRFCTAAGQMEFSASGGLDTAPPGYAPWFSHPRQTESSTVVFGHWSALGLQQHSNFIGLDSACVWGGKLSAVRLSDHRLIQVDCPGHQEVISTCKAAATAPRAINANSRR